MGELIKAVFSSTTAKTSYTNEINNLAMWMAIIAVIAAIVMWMGFSMTSYAFVSFFRISSILNFLN